MEESATARTDDRLVDGTPVGHVLGAAEAAIDTADPVSLGRSYLRAMRRRRHAKSDRAPTLSTRTNAISTREAAHAFA